MNSNKLSRISFLIGAALMLGAAQAQTQPATTQAAPRPPSGPAKVLKAFDFEKDAAGWEVEAGEGAKKPTSMQLVKGFRGSMGSLRITGPNEHNGLAATNALSYPGTDTKVTLAYKTVDCETVMGQGQVPALKKQLHGSVPDFRNGQWTVATLNVDKWTPWSGNENGLDQQFTTLMLIANVNPGSRNGEFQLDDVIVWQGRDTTPPTPVEQVKGELDAAAGEVVLAWPLPKDDIAVARFTIYRSLNPDFEPSPATRLGETAELSYHDGMLNNFGTYYYKVVAEDASGNLAKPSQALKVTVKP